MNTYISVPCIFKCSTVQLKTLMYLNQELQKLAEEYYRLISLEEPSEEELYRLEEILKLATIDEKLNDLLIKIDEDIALEMGLINNETASKSCVKTLVSFIADEYCSQQFKRLIHVTFVCLMSLGLLLLLKQCNNIQAKLIYHTTFNYYKVPALIEKKEADKERVLSKREKDIPNVIEEDSDTLRQNTQQNKIFLEKQQK
ncbi:hypothetical protein NIES4071_71680 [Calothrix sp. NIES-4071]|nr:hypothetical protein NIES4071_71680 [Calothrix sp. NIES-4071]BAZ61443.1 hypothetical protein NIES4105_71630 [Calothrix sp. NIES-4105]